MKLRDFAMLMFLASIWGASFLFIHIAVPVFGPVPLVTFRVLLAGAILLGYAYFKKETLDYRSNWKQFILLGTLNSAIPFSLIAFASLHLNTSTTALLNTSTPLFTAILSAFLLKDAFTPQKVVGLVLGVIGVGFVVGWSPFDLSTTTILAIGASLSAGFFYGLGTVFAKSHFQKIPAVTMAIGQQFGAGLVLTPFAVTNLPSTMTTDALIPAIILGVLCTAFAYLLYFTLVRNAGATNTSTVTLLVPVFSIVWAAIFLGEEIQPGQIFGFTIILVGLVLLTGLYTNFVKTKRDVKIA
jgi:drug/metabolite transporter (DMT)-like permease